MSQILNTQFHILVLYLDIKKRRKLQFSAYFSLLVKQKRRTRCERIEVNKWKSKEIRLIIINGIRNLINIHKNGFCGDF